MGTRKYQNKTTFIRCPKDVDHLYNLVPVNLYKLDPYQFALMAHIISNKDNWIIVKKEIQQRVKLSRPKFEHAWKSLIEMGYIVEKQIQGGWSYTIYEDPYFTSTADGICENLTYTAGGQCGDGILTNTKINYSMEVTSTTCMNSHDGEFQELFALYPSEVMRPDGLIRNLRTKVDVCKKLYGEYLDSGRMTHDEIITALKVELNYRQVYGKEKYQQTLYNWLVSRTFETYKGRNVIPNELSYGQELL